ncbi:MAG TPA: TfoX/Sxy family protein [Thermomicrobiales bacterium]|nr:TfoX/Sxy family protein [Thermomicrobiales bacterium]
MAQDKAFVQDIVDMLMPLDVWTRSMFGSVGLYCDGKFVGLVSDDQLFIKRSGADPDLFAATELGRPFPGAKEWHLVTADLYGESEWLREAVQATADALPFPKPKKTKTPRQSENPPA